MHQNKLGKINKRIEKRVSEPDDNLSFDSSDLKKNK